MAKRKRSMPVNADLPPSGEALPGAEAGATEPAIQAVASAALPAMSAHETKTIATTPEIVAGVASSAEIVSLRAMEPSTEASPPMPPPEESSMLRKNWFSLRAATIAFAAALGAILGSLAPTVVDLRAARADATIVLADPVVALQASVTKLVAEVGALRAAVAAAEQDASSGLAKLAERLDTSETMQGALVERVTRIAEGLGTQPQKVATPEVTGSITPARPQIARGWTLWRIYGGRALVEGNGDYYEVAPGSDLPGLGRVQKITRANGQWVVVTSKGVILPERG